MKIGIGLPASHPERLHEWARARVARSGDGLLCAAEAERLGRPRNVAQISVALGRTRPSRRRDGRSARLHRRPRPDGRRRADDAGRDPGRHPAFADLGVDEVVLYCWAGDPAQVERLRDAVG